MSKHSRGDIKDQAIQLAQETKKTEPKIMQIYWFPDDHEVRLVELEDDTVVSLSGYVEPFYFDPAPQDDLPAPSGIALIRPDEFGKLRLPDGWGTWDDAEELKVEI